MVGLQLVQELRLTQQLIMTPQLQMAIKLLQVTQFELVDIVQRELAENPVLEEGTDSEGRDARKERVGDEEARTPDASVPTGEARLEKLDREQLREGKQESDVNGSEEVNWDRYLENHANQPPMPSVARDVSELPDFEATLTQNTSLFDHVLWQIQMSSFVENERRFAVSIIGNLDRDGYLSSDVTLKELAEEAGLHPEDAEEVLYMVQDLDPVGVGARDLRECLLAQVRGFELDEDVRAIIDHHLVNLERANFREIARDLDLELEDVHDAARIISKLEPRPGRGFVGEESYYITPDVYVYNLGGEYFVVANDDGMPKLKISGYYRAAMSGDAKAKEYIQGKLRSAQWLIRSIDQRRRTIIKVTECIVEKQKGFFENGIDNLKPMILRDVAETVGMHESTISRVTNGKYMHTPRGVFELKYFFNAGIRQRGGGDIANESVKQSIKKIVDGEDKRKPLSDQKIVDVLETQGVVIARRTVAKYREMLGVLSSSKRRKRY